MTPRRPLRTALAAAALPLFVAGLAACSSAGTASADSIEEQTREWDAALASCVSDAGFDLEDPALLGDDEGKGATADFDALGEALETCQEQVEADHGPRPASEADQDDEEATMKELLRVQECLQEHGVDVHGAEEGVFSASGEIPEDVAATCDAEQFTDPEAADR